MEIPTVKELVTEKTDSTTISYFLLRQLIGILGILLPFALKYDLKYGKIINGIMINRFLAKLSVFSTLKGLYIYTNIHNGKKEAINKNRNKLL